MRRYIIVAQNKKTMCVLWLDVEHVAECYAYTNQLFLTKGWGRPSISAPVEVTDAESIQVASNNEEVCQFLHIEDEASTVNEMRIPHG